jgi:predicted metal-dependent hydrolase
MSELTLAGEPPIVVALRRTARARRLTLRISGLDGQVTLTVPPHVGADDARAFVRSREAWLRSKLGSVPEPVAVGHGTVLPVEGVPTGVRIRPGRAAHGGEELAASSVPAIEAYLRHLARERLATCVDRHTARLGRKATAIALRDTRSRWGSCSSAGRLMFSWRLVLAPPAVLNYVAAHEVAHLAEMNHSAAFWNQVERLCPGYRPERAWLRREGAALHRWQFRH